MSEVCYSIRNVAIDAIQCKYVYKRFAKAFTVQYGCIFIRFDASIVKVNKKVSFSKTTEKCEKPYLLFSETIGLKSVQPTRVKSIILNFDIEFFSIKEQSFQGRRRSTEVDDSIRKVKVLSCILRLKKTS